jgi:pantoate--beta-alanine ligase
MSSRNSYLTPEQRPAALSLFKALNKAKELLADGINDASKIIEASSELIKSHGNTAIDYIAICDPETLEDMKIIDRSALMALAVNVGKARLIDNILLNPN